MTGRTVLTVVWLAICGVFAGLLLHPGVPGLLQSIADARQIRASAMLDYAAHFIVFFVATELAYVCLDADVTRRRTILAVAAIAGVVVEYSQRWIPGRGVSLFDASCNLAGAVAAAAVYSRVFTGGLAANGREA